jgi:small redox-active disulfide protein 2
LLNAKILGPGCVNCYRVEQVAIDALEMLGLEATLQHITDQEKMRQYGILYTPGLVVNERLVCAGRIPSIKEVISWAEEALAQEQEEQNKG